MPSLVFAIPTVPNTTTFSLQDVCNEIYGQFTAGMNLNQCFTDATGTFDPSYVGSKNSLLNFRNYTHSFVGIRVTLDASMASENGQVYVDYATSSGNGSIQFGLGATGVFLEPKTTPINSVSVKLIGSLSNIYININTNGSDSPSNFYPCSTPNTYSKNLLGTSGIIVDIKIGKMLV